MTALAAPAALDLQEGIATPAFDGEVKCGRWPEHYRLYNAHTGELVRGRCRATNLCLYCRVLGVVETAEMWKLDAEEYAPTLLAVLTAREHLSRAQLRDHLSKLRRAAKSRWPAVEWAVSIEFQRRGALHANLLIKGVPVEHQEQLRELWFGRRLANRRIERGIWTSRVDAVPEALYLGELSSAGGAISYLNEQLVHGLKQEQAPPIGWRGHRTSQTRGYLVRPASVMRQEARDSLRRKRTLHRFIEAGQPADLIEALMIDAETEHEAAQWQLQRVRREVLAPGSMTPPERDRPARVPIPMLEAAWRWQDERELVREARAHLGERRTSPGRKRPDDTSGAPPGERGVARPAGAPPCRPPGPAP